jgi:hypothetical protein
VKPWDGFKKGSSRRREEGKKKRWQDRERSKAVEKRK